MHEQTSHEEQQQLAQDFHQWRKKQEAERRRREGRTPGTLLTLASIISFAFAGIVAIGAFLSRGYLSIPTLLVPLSGTILLLSLIGIFLGVAWEARK